MSYRIRRLALWLRKQSVDGVPPGTRVSSRPSPWFALRPTVGIGVSATSVRAVGVAGDAIRWAIELDRHESEPLSDTIAALIERAPITRPRGDVRGRASRSAPSNDYALPSGPRGWPIPGWLRPRVVVAIGPSAVQLKRLTGLPPLDEVAALELVVREGAGRFFLKNGVPLVTTAVQLVEPGTAWAAAFDAPVVDEMERACKAADLRLEAVVPAAIALVHAVSLAAGRERLVWTDGAIRTELTFSGGHVESLRRLPSMGTREHSADFATNGNASATEDLGQPLPVEPLTKLGDRALAFADAYGATRLAQRLTRDEPLILRAGSAALGSWRQQEASTNRLAVAALAFLLAAASAIAGPPLAAIRSARDAKSTLHSIEKRITRAERQEADLSRVSRALSEVASFERSRRSTTILLANLTRVLPKDAALVALDADTVGGTLVALGTRASQITTALEKVKEIARPEIVGPVTRETAGTREVERVTVRFKFARGSEQ